MAGIPAFREPTLAAGLATLALAAWLVYLNPGNRLHRAFALFLLLQGGIYTLTPFAGPVYSSWEARSIGYLVLALPFAGLHLVHRLRDCFLLGDPVRRSGPAGPFLGWGILLAAVLVEALYFRDHALLYGWDGANVSFGPLYFFDPLTYTTFAAVGLALALQARRLTDATGRRALAVGAVAFAGEPLYWSSRWLATYAFTGLPEDARGQAVLAIEAATILLAAAALAVLIARRGAMAGRGRRWASALCAAAVASGVGVAAVLAFAGWTDPHQYLLLFGLDAFWHLALVALTAAAVLRHRFLVMETQIRFSLERGTVAAVFVAVFFIVSESVQQVVSQFFAELSFGKKAQYVGIVAAGLLLFAIAPLQRLAERLVDAAVPHPDVEGMGASQRESLFREQARFAWTDGTLTRLERRRLDHLRDRLGLGAEEAARIELEAVAELDGAAASRPPRARRPVRPVRPRPATPE